MPAARPAPKRSFDHLATTDFWRALGSGDAARFRRLLAQGANPNAKGTDTPFGRDSLLQAAAEAGDAVAVEVLLAAGARQVGGRHGVTPLLAAAQGVAEHGQTHLDAYRLLLEKARDPLAGGGAVVASSPLSALMRPRPWPAACETAFGWTLAKLRPRHWEADPRAAFDALSHAVQHHSLAVFQALRAAGASTSGTTGFAGDAPVGLAGLFQSRVGLFAVADEDAWWAALADANPPPGFAGSDLDRTAAVRMGQARAEAKADALEGALPERPGPSRRGPRL